MENDVVILQVPRPGLPLVIISWLMLFLLAAFATIPVLGIVSWLVAIPVLVMTLVFAVVVLINGRTINGILILIASLLAPFYIQAAPIVSMFLVGYMMEGDCVVTMKDDQGRVTKKKGHIKNLSISDWKHLEEIEVLDTVSAGENGAGDSSAKEKIIVELQVPSSGAAGQKEEKSEKSEEEKAQYY